MQIPAMSVRPNWQAALLYMSFQSTISATRLQGICMYIEHLPSPRGPQLEHSCPGKCSPRLIWALRQHQQHKGTLMLEIKAKTSVLPVFKYCVCVHKRDNGNTAGWITKGYFGS